LFGLGYWVSGQATSRQAPAPQTVVAPLPSRPSVIVVPFADLGETAASRLYATGLTEEVLSQLARFTELTVLGRDTSNSLAPSADAGRLRRDLGFRYAIEGSVRTSNGRLRVTARLIDAEAGAVLWSQAYDENLEARDFLAIQSDVAQKVATAVGQPYGVIFRADERRSRPPEDPEAYACTSQYYTYRAVRSPERHAALRNCMERTVARVPGYATALAMLSFLYLDEDRFGFNVKPGSPTALERATDAARRAISLNPEDVRALQALMMSLFLNREHEEAVRVGERALAVNPNDTELMGELGSRVSLAGNWQRGAALVEGARALNPAQSGFYNGTLALCAYMLGNYPAAAALIRQTSSDRYPYYHLVAAVTYAQLGLQKEAGEARALFVRQRPDFEARWHDEWDKRLTRTADQAHLEEGARKAGFSIPPQPGARPALLER
jgi:TolB-like protein